MSLISFDNSYVRLPEPLFSRVDPTPVTQPQLIAMNTQVAELLGLSLDALSPDEQAQFFAGNRIFDGSEPIATAYSGHQFGNWNPTLGDGRAILLGEVMGADGIRRDIQLKGSGRTPFSRNGDGRSWLGPVLREYVVSEAMHALGIPTTRALAAITTGENVQRETALAGGILTRVAQSHIRVGTFQFFAARRDVASLKALYDHVVARHYPDATTPLDLFTAVMTRQAKLIAKWMSVGFIHGVMNTDNCQIAGETIDYGPCAFMDRYHPDQVFSSIDRGGRYRYAAQPDIGMWNMAQFATALIPLLPDQDAAIESFTDVLHSYAEIFKIEHEKLFCAKIGLTNIQKGDMDLVSSLLDLMADGQADFTNMFRALGDGSARDHVTQREAFDPWHAEWQQRIAREPDPLDLMAKTNPAVIPRNHQIEAMIQSALNGDYAAFHRLNTALSTPFEITDPALTLPPTDSEIVQNTFCGT